MRPCRDIQETNNLALQVMSGMTLEEGVNDQNIFKVVLMAGGPGSGKSLIVDNVIGKKGPVSALGAIVVNSDDILEKKLKDLGLPEVFDKDKPEQYAKQMDVRNLAKALTEKRLARFLDGMLPLVIDGTGRDYAKIKRLKDAFEGLGYDTAMVFVDTTLEVSQERNQMRARKVSPDEVEKMWNGVQKNKPKLKSLFGKDFILVDNNKALEGAALNEFRQKLFKAGKRLLERPLRNKRGITAINVLKATGGKTLSDLGACTQRQGCLQQIRKDAPS